MWGKGHVHRVRFPAVERPNFNGRLWYELLDREIFCSMTEALVALTQRLPREARAGHIRRATDIPAESKSRAGQFDPITGGTKPHRRTSYGHESSGVRMRPRVGHLQSCELR